MLKSELEQKYQNMLKIAVNLEQLKNAYKEKCELLEQQVEALQMLLASSDISND